MKYILKNDYIAENGISRRWVNLQIRDGKLKEIKIDKTKYIIIEDIQPPEKEIKLNDETKFNIVETKKEEYKERIKAIAIYIRNHGRDEKSNKRIEEILREIKVLNERGIRIKGFGQRNIQIMIKKLLNGATGLNRKMRADKYRKRLKLIKEKPAVYDLTIDLICDLLMKDPLHSLRNAIDRARYESEKNEELWEMRAINLYTLKNWMNQEMKSAGFKTVMEYANHRNEWRKRLAYVKGAFTKDITFREVYAVDDRKADVAGALEYNPESGRMETKKVYMWTCCDAHTGQVLGFSMKANDFNEEDLIILMMRVFKRYGLPKKKIIYDNGLMSGERCRQFFNRLHLEAAGVVAEAQKEYSPTDKATIERIHKMMKEETDIYNKNFVGSNHQKEGRHEGLALSPEMTTALISEEVCRYESYFEGYFMDRPRDFAIPGIEHLKDNTGRVSIRRITEHYYRNYKMREISDEQLCYAYMKYDVVKNLENYFIKFKKELYLPAEPLSPALNDSSYRYFVAYNPNDLNSLYLYTAQDILDKITGAVYKKGDKICRMDSLANLSSDDKKMKIAIYNKKIKKHTLALANAYRGRFAANKEIANIVIDRDDRLYDIAKGQIKEIENMIKNAVPSERIEEMLETTDNEIDRETAFSEDAINKINDIEI